jgi:hypothetical protein
MEKAQEEAMSGALAGLDLVPDGDGFSLSVTNASGKTSVTRLTAEQLLVLAQSAPLFRERILSQRHPAPGSVDAVVATPVIQIALNTDALDQDLLLTLYGSNWAGQTFAVPAHIAQLLVERLPDWIAKLKVSKTKQ